MDKEEFINKWIPFIGAGRTGNFEFDLDRLLNEETPRNNKIEVDSDREIISKPILLCTSCYRENCNGECWWAIRFYKRIKLKIKSFIK